MWSSKESFESKIIPSNSFVFSDMIVWSSILALTLSFPENSIWLSHYSLFSGNDNVSANIDDHTIISENKNELLGIILDSKLSFEDHIRNQKRIYNTNVHKTIYNTDALFELYKTF